MDLQTKIKNTFKNFFASIKEYFAAKDHVHNAASASADGFLSSSDKKKLDTVNENADANQNAFSNVKVGGTTLAASAEQDTVEFEAGTGLEAEAVEDGKKVIFRATGEATAEEAK